MNAPMTNANLTRIREAEAAALVLRDAAGCCSSDQDSLRARLLRGAQAIDDMVELLEQTAFAAKLNRDTLIARAET